MGQKNSHHDSAKRSADCGPGLGLCDAPESRQRMVNNMGEDHPLLRLLCQHAALNDAEGIRRECGAADGIARSLINTPTRVTGLAPLHVAAKVGSTDAAMELLRQGARSDALSLEGRLPSQYAYSAGHTYTAQVLTVSSMSPHQGNVGFGSPTASPSPHRHIQGYAVDLSAASSAKPRRTGMSAHLHAGERVQTPRGGKHTLAAVEGSIGFASGMPRSNVQGEQGRAPLAYRMAAAPSPRAVPANNNPAGYRMASPSPRVPMQTSDILGLQVIGSPPSPQMAPESHQFGNRYFVQGQGGVGRPPRPPVMETSPSSSTVHRPAPFSIPLSPSPSPCSSPSKPHGGPPVPPPRAPHGIPRLDLSRADGYGVSNNNNNSNNGYGTSSISRASPAPNPPSIVPRLNFAPASPPAYNALGNYGGIMANNNGHGVSNNNGHYMTAGNGVGGGGGQRGAVVATSAPVMAHFGKPPLQPSSSKPPRAIASPPQPLGGSGAALEGQDDLEVMRRFVSLASSNDGDAIRRLCQSARGFASLNRLNPDGLAPIHVAAHLGKLSALTALVECGANMHCVSSEGKMAGDYAVEARHPDVLRIMELERERRAKLRSKAQLVTPRRGSTASASGASTPRRPSTSGQPASGASTPRRTGSGDISTPRRAGSGGNGNQYAGGRSSGASTPRSGVQGIARGAGGGFRGGGLAYGQGGPPTPRSVSGSVRSGGTGSSKAGGNGMAAKARARVQGMFGRGGAGKPPPYV